ncbi:hypothetical protein [Streptomyces globisporus]|uniref:hypothetical protein n=1 Tax=Streptomyces globisporus TaxID=1908 RepID=UPI00378BBF21
MSVTHAFVDNPRNSTQSFEPRGYLGPVCPPRPTDVSTWLPTLVARFQPPPVF